MLVPGRLSSHLFAILAVGATASAFYASTGLGTVWPLTWVAPIPVLILALRRSWLTALLVAFGGFFLGGLNTPYGIGGWIVFGLPPAIAFAAATVAFRAAARRTSSWQTIFVFPVLLTTYEFLFAWLSPNGTLWSLAYSQTNFLPVLQLVSLAGLWGVVFVLSLVPPAAALAWQRRSVSPLVPALVITLAVIGYGSVRLRDASVSGSVRVGLAATDHGLPDAAITTDTSRALVAAEAYAARVARLAVQGAEIIVLPEKMVGVTPASDRPVIDVLGESARAAGVRVIAGLSRALSFRRRTHRGVREASPSSDH
jgi:apolipoprotein N-acyltransferase